MYPSGLAIPRSVTDPPSNHDHPRSVVTSGSEPTILSRVSPRRSVGLFSQHHCPRDPGVLVREGYGRDVHRSPIKETADPAVPPDGRPFSPADNRASAVDQQASNVPIAAFRDGAEALLAAARPLLRHQAQPRRELAPGFELAGITARRSDGTRRDRADAGNGRQPPARLVRLVPGEQFPLNLLYTCGDIAELSRKNAQHGTCQLWQPGISRPIEKLKAALDIADAPTRDDAELGEVSANGADETAPLADQQLAGTVEEKSGPLIGALERHEPHRWTPDRCADRLGIGHVVLLARDVGLDKPRRHQPHLMAQGGDLARPVMGGVACLHADKSRLEICKQSHNLCPTKLPLQHSSSGLINLSDQPTVGKSGAVHPIMTAPDRIARTINTPCKPASVHTWNWR